MFLLNCLAVKEKRFPKGKATAYICMMASHGHGRDTPCVSRL